MDRLPRSTILFVCCWGMTLLSLATITPSVGLTDMGEELSMSFTDKGILLAAPFWGITIAIILSGVVADRIGFRIPLIASTVMQSAGCLLMSLANTPFMAYGGAFLAGCGSGTADALFTPIICAIYPQRRTKMSNLLHAFYPVGLIITIVLMTAMLELGWHWRGVFKVLAVLPLPVLVAIIFLPLPSKTHEGNERQRTRNIVGKLPFILLATGIFLVGVTEMAPMGWLPDYIASAIVGSPLQGRLGLLLCAVTMVMGRLSGSALVERLGVKRLFIACGVLCSISLLMAAMPVGPNFTIFWLALLAFAVASLWPTILGHAGDRFPRAGASMYSLLGAAGNFGGVVGPITVGLIAQAGRPHIAMGVLAIAPLAALAAMTLAKPAKGPIRTEM